MVSERPGPERDLERAYEANVTIPARLGFKTVVEAALRDEPRAQQPAEQ